MRKTIIDEMTLRELGAYCVGMTWNLFVLFLGTRLLLTVPQIVILVIPGFAAIALALVWRKRRHGLKRET